MNNELNTLMQVGNKQIILMIIGLLIFILVPIMIALIWAKKKHESFKTILIGAITFLLFALILEKPIQNIIIFPSTMGLSEHSISIFINSHPILLALLTGLFPGIFEESGRYFAFKFFLKNKKNKETSISYGIGHGCFEVILILGITYIQNIVYSIMINTGTFEAVIEQVALEAPNQLSSVMALVNALSAFSITDLCMAVFERIFAVLFHIGASILVFYACKDAKKFNLYLLAITLHTLLDFIGALTIFKIINISTLALEIILAIFGLITFMFSYKNLYLKDNN